MNDIEVRKPRGSILVCVMLFMLLLSVLTLSITTMMLCYYESVENTLSYKKCFLLAQGGREEALAFLSEHWKDTMSPWYTIDTGEYRYQVSNMGLNEKKIISSGRINGVERKIETRVTCRDEKMDIRALCDYSVYCDGSFILGNTKNMESNIEDPLLAIRGDFTVKNITEGKLRLAGTNKINVENSFKNEFFQHFTIWDKNVAGYTMDSMIPYVEWLRANYDEEVLELDFNGNDGVIHNTSNESKDILYIHNAARLLINDLTFNGIVLLDDIESINIDDETHINGALIASGIKTSELTVEGRIKGTLILINMINSHIYFDGYLKHDDNIINELINYLPDDLTVNNSTKKMVDMIKWNEID